jgi:hypothetical protein
MSAPRETRTWSHKSGATKNRGYITPTICAVASGVTKDSASDWRTTTRKNGVRLNPSVLVLQDGENRWPENTTALRSRNCVAHPHT